MKIGLVGCGHVGSASLYACVMQGLASEYVLVDKFTDLAIAQAEDILHATPFAAPANIRAGSYEDLENADLVMIAAGVNQKPGETRLDLLKRNADIFNSIIPDILKYAKNALLLVATNPVDVMTHMTAKIAHDYNGHPASKIIGSGTILDTARFRSLIGQHLGVSSHSVHAYVLGEHGDSEVLHWSGANIGNLRLANFAAQRKAPITDKVKEKIDNNVRNAAYKIIKGKGATWYGIGAGMAAIVKAVANDQNAVLTCAAPVDDLLGVQDVTLSLPRIISRQGIEGIMFPELNTAEEQALQKSASILKEAITDAGF